MSEGYRPNWWPTCDARITQGDSIAHWIGRGHLGVLDIALELHCDHTGSGEIWPRENVELYIRALRHALSSWTCDRMCMFDDAVKGVIESAIAERGLAVSRKGTDE